MRPQAARHPATSAQSQSLGIMAVARVIIARCCIVVSLVPAFGINTGNAEVTTEAEQWRAEVKPPAAEGKFGEIRQLIRDGHCQRAWNELVELVERKDHEAPFFLLGLMIAGGMGAVVPAPSRPVDETEARALILTLEFYATLSAEGGRKRREIANYLDTIAPDAKGGEAVVSCFKSAEPSEVCVNLASANHIILSYDEFIASLKRLDETTRFECKKAQAITFCLRYDRHLP